MCTRAHTPTCTFRAHSHTNRLACPYVATALLFHYLGALLASAPLLLGRLNAGELGQTARLEEKGTDGWGVVAVVVCGVRERWSGGAT